MAVITDTIDLSAHCETHPVGLMSFARSSFGLKTWDMDAIEFLKDNLLVDDEDKDNVVEVDNDDDDDDKDEEHGTSGWKRKRLADMTPEEIDAANLAAGDVNF